MSSRRPWFPAHIVRPSFPVTSTSAAARTRIRRAVFVACASLVVGACSDAPLAPDAVVAPGDERAVTSVRWNLVARQLVIGEGTSAPRAARVYANLSVAQYVAARAARDLASAGGERSWPRVPSPATAPSVRAAIAAASAVITEFHFPWQVPVVQRELALQLEALGSAGQSGDAIAAGRQVGEAVATIIARRAMADGADAPWGGSAPAGAFVWRGTDPLEPQWGRVRPWLIASGRAVRAPPPPAPGTPEFDLALAEVRSISDARTPEQLEQVLFWADGPRTPTPAGHWNEIAAGMIAAYAVSEMEATEALARLNMAVMDATIGCWDSKYTYWLARPYEMDPAIRTPIAQPPHPSYPSGHACMSGAAAAVLASIFPAERAALETMELAACDSRVYGGLHYRFDSKAGQELGAAVARVAIETWLPGFAQALVH